MEPMDAPFTSEKRMAARPRLAGESDEQRIAYLRELLNNDTMRAHDALEFINLLLKRFTKVTV